LTPPGRAQLVDDAVPNPIYPGTPTETPPMTLPDRQRWQQLSPLLDELLDL